MESLSKRSYPSRSQDGNKGRKRPRATAIPHEKHWAIHDKEDEEEIFHEGLLGEGGYGEVHKVSNPQIKRLLIGARCGIQQLERYLQCFHGARLVLVPEFTPGTESSSCHII
jgi:hypothetical protein